MSPSSAPPPSIARRAWLVGLLGLAVSGASAASGDPSPTHIARTRPRPADTTAPADWPTADERRGVARPTAHDTHCYIFNSCQRFLLKR